LAAGGQSLYLFTMQRKCPTCRRTLDAAAAASPNRPFCSERCRTADLGGWLDGAYRIASPLSEEDLDQGLSPADGDGDGQEQDQQKEAKRPQ
jgi:endogenous inhibitor of DNA gyrase (YacG/DUF329 family)